jgi:hypothetical protein
LTDATLLQPQAGAVENDTEERTLLAATPTDSYVGGAWTGAVAAGGLHG